LPAARQSSSAPKCEVYAVRFAHAPYPTARLGSGAERGVMTDIAFTGWPIKDTASNRIILVDSGFYRGKFIQQWKPQDYVRPSEAVASGLGIKPDDVTDVVITHSHWDHADGADLFPKARIWIQKEEYEYYVGPNGEALHGADADVTKMLGDL